MKITLGKKQNMTQIFDNEGNVHPATVVSAGPLVVTQVKTKDTDGYEAIQVGFGTRNPKNINKAQQGHFKDLGNFEVLREFEKGSEDVKVGDTIDLSVFQVGDVVTVSSISKGKGFQGVIKRHNFAGQPRSHGQKHTERAPGSIGATGPQRVFKGTRMGGRMGSDRITTKNLKVVAVDTENNQIYIQGAIAGRRGTLVEIVS